MGWAVSAVDVLSVMDAAARRIARECRACMDPTACTECDMAKPLREARAAVAQMRAALMQVHRMGYSDVGDRLMVEAALARVQGEQP